MWARTKSRVHGMDGSAFHGMDDGRLWRQSFVAINALGS
jgi:hypothetical protein